MVVLGRYHSPYRAYIGLFEYRQIPSGARGYLQDAKHNTRNNPYDAEINKKWMPRGGIPQGEYYCKQQRKADVTANDMESEVER